jgi:hypothetical protein
MAYDCRTYRILIASPSDVEEEREIAVRVIQEWNDLYSYSRKIALLPLRWETHTAPEYGKRPQEVINRAIVDECDLLVGIFWTRIGSPTGAAESGTLEEIERVGKAQKPVMLYFSRVGIDPERIDLPQIEKLKLFKKKSYPKGLSESYKSHIEFRDKFAKQLELKIRDLQQSEKSGELPLSLEFLSVEKGNLIGETVYFTFDYPLISDYKEIPQAKLDKFKEFVARQIKQTSFFPVALAIENSTPSGIRNLYVELNLIASSDSLEVTDLSYKGYLSQLPDSDIIWTSQVGAIGTFAFDSQIQRPSFYYDDFQSKLAQFDADKLQETDQGWRFSFEWEALQPQRIRLIKPALSVFSSESAKLSIRAKVFADSFSSPIELEANVNIEIRSKETPLRKVIPEWKKILEEMKSN